MHSFVGLLPLSVLDCIISWVHFCTFTIWVVLTIIPWVRFALFAVAGVYIKQLMLAFITLLLRCIPDVPLFVLHFFNLKATQVFTSTTTVTKSSTNRTPTVAPNTVFTVPERCE